MADAGYISKIKVPTGDVYSIRDTESKDAIDRKIFFDDRISGVSGYNDLSVIKLSADEYAGLLVSNALLSNALYIVEDSSINAYGQQIKNLAAGTDLSDAVNLEQLNNSISSIPLDDYLPLSGGTIFGNVNLEANDFNLLSGNYIQTITPDGIHAYGSNSFIQAESTAKYGSTSIGSRGFIIIGVVSAENKVILSVDGLSNINDCIPESCYTSAWSIALDNKLDAQFSEISAVGTDYVVFKSPFKTVADLDGEPESYFTNLIAAADDNALYCPTHPEVGNTVIATFTSNHAEGGSTHAIAQYSHAEGRYTFAEGRYSHSEGHGTIAGGTAAHAEGMGSKVLTNYGAHAEGYSTTATGQYGAHAEGCETNATGARSHAEGYSSHAVGDNSHAEGVLNFANGHNSHAEGKQAYADGNMSHAEGLSSTASGLESHAEGFKTTASNEAAHAEGERTTASGEGAHAEGRETTASGKFSHAEGGYYESGSYTKGGTASGAGSHAEGILTEASGVGAHAEGRQAKAEGNYSHAEGGEWKSGTGYLSGGWAKEYGSHAEGVQTSAFAIASHAEGKLTYSYGAEAHTEGYAVSATAEAAHAEGERCIASGEGSHAEGRSTKATGNFAHAEGGQKNSSTSYNAGGWATGDGAHAEGVQTSAFATAAHAEGKLTYAGKFASHVEGWQTSADGEFAYAGGYKAYANANNQFVWNGASKATSDPVYIGNDGIYASGQYKGYGTFNVNPMGGLSGFYIGGDNLCAIIDNAIADVYIPTDLSAFTNSPGYLVSNDISDIYKKSETSSAIEISSALEQKSKVMFVDWED